MMLLVIRFRGFLSSENGALQMIRWGMGPDILDQIGRDDTWVHSQEATSKQNSM